MGPFRRIRDLLRPRRGVAAEVDEELRFHIEGRIRERVEQGVPEERARREVLKCFGDYESVERACRRYSEQRVEREGWTMKLDALKQDLRLGWRSLRRDPVFTAVVVVTLALGIGATTSIFTVVDGVLLTPLPYADPGELVFVWQNDRATGTEREAAGSADYFDFAERSRSFREMAMFTGERPVTWTRPGEEATRLGASLVWHNLSEVLGVPPRLGRGIGEADSRPGAPPVAVLSHELWQSSFGGDPGVIGRTLLIDEVPTEVVGVLQEGLEFPSSSVDLWMPLQSTPATATRSPHSFRIIGRLDPDTDVATAHAEMIRIAAELEAEVPANANRGALVEPVTDYLRGDVAGTLWVLFGGVLTLLLIACGNVANLLLARGTARSREVAVHSALGADAGRMARRFVVEGLLLTGAATLLGIAFAVLGTRGLLTLAPQSLRGLADPTVDLGVLGFALATAVAVGIGCGLVPTFQARGLDIVGSLKDGDPRSGSGGGMALRKILVAVQLAMAVVLLVASGLMVNTLRNMSRVDLGFEHENLLRMTFQLPESRYPRDFAEYPDWPEVLNFMETAVRDVEALPGVDRAAITYNHPLDSGFTNSFTIEGRAYDPEQGEMTTRMVSPSYLETAGLRLVEGRFLDDPAGPGAPGELVLNQTAARRHFPDGDALGARISFWGQAPRTVVGIVEDERVTGVTAETPPAMYLDILRSPPRGGGGLLLVRTSLPPGDVIGTLRQTLNRLDAAVPLFDVSTMTETLHETVGRERFTSRVLVAFALVAVVLAVLGVHGALSYQVARRRREVGLRMALGASRGRVLRLIVRQGMQMALVGLAVGLVLAAMASRLLEGFLFGIEPTDPLTYGSVAALLLAAALAGVSIPARRATHVDPMDSLRGD